MSKNNKLFLGNYDFSVSVKGFPVELDSKLIRINQGDSIIINLDLSNIEITEENPQVRKVVLHTNMTDGRWQYLPMSDLLLQGSGKNGVYVLKLKAGFCGRSAFRFAVVTDEGQLWEAEDYHQLLVDPAGMDGLCLYTLIPKAAGTIADWTEKLDSIAAMGFNAVHILPFTKMGASESPYSAADLFKIDEVYGGSIDVFSNFCAAAAEHDIMICLDIVLNHVGSDNIICREHAEWIIPDGKRSDGMKRAGCYHNNEWISWEDLVLINYDHPVPEIRLQIYNYMLKYVIFWLDAAGGSNHIIRLDNLHSSNESFIRWLIPEIRKSYPGVIILSEYFGAEHHLDEAVVKYGLNLITANSWEFPFAPQLERYIAGLHSEGNEARYLITPVSHDTESAAKLFGGALSSIPRYAACALMGTGTTGIVQGYESGLPSKLEFIGKARILPADTGIDFGPFINAVNKLVKTENCLRQKGNAEFYDTGNDSLIVCRRKGLDGGGILIVVNLDIYNEHSLKYHLICRCETLLSENANVINNKNEDSVNINLKPCGACVIRIKK